jgi:hypothetical protein
MKDNAMYGICSTLLLGKPEEKKQLKTLFVLDKMILKSVSKK